MTKKQRNKIYREALKLIKNEKEEFICHSLPKRLLKQFEEFFLVMPEQWDGCNCLFGRASDKWFTDEEYDTIDQKKFREIILEFCIAMTE